MTSPSEPPLDLDVIRARAEAVMNPYWNPQNADHWAIAGAEDALAMLAEVDRLRAEVEKLGWIKTESMFLLGKMLGGIVADARNAEQRVESTRYSVEALVTRIATYDEAANGHQQPGERFPSHETSEGAQVDPDADERGNASAFRQSSGSSPSWGGIEP